MVEDIDRLASTRILANKTGKKAEQGNSIIVTVAENKITTPIKIAKFFLLANTFSILGDNLEIIPLELQAAPCFLDFMYSLIR